MRAEADAEREALVLRQSLAGLGLWCEAIERTEPAENMEEENAGRRPEAVAMAWHALTWRSENSCMRACVTLKFACSAS